MVLWFDSCQAMSSPLFSRGSCESSSPPSSNPNLTKLKIQHHINHLPHCEKKLQQCNITSHATASEGIRQVATPHLLWALRIEKTRKQQPDLHTITHQPQVHKTRNCKRRLERWQGIPGTKPEKEQDIENRKQLAGRWERWWLWQTK